MKKGRRNRKFLHSWVWQFGRVTIDVIPTTSWNSVKSKTTCKTLPMAMTTVLSKSFLCPKSLSSHRSRNPSFPFVDFPSSSVRYSRNLPRKSRLISASASAAGRSGSEGDFSPYEVLGVSPIEGFDMMKAAYTRKRKDAERRGDEEAAARLDKAYDKVMMAQLTNRKKGVTFGSFKVSKDVKFADKEPIVPWGPRFTRSSSQDMKINLAIAAVFTAWVVFKCNAEYKPLQFLAFVFVYRIFEKLKAYEPPVSPTFSEDGEDPGRGVRMGKRLLRSLALAFGCIAFASLAYTGILNLIEFVGGYVPLFLYNNQELLVTVSTAIMLYIMASYYR